MPGAKFEREAWNGEGRSSIPQQNVSGAADSGESGRGGPGAESALPFQKFVGGKAMFEFSLFGLSPHHTQDIVNYLFFLIGQWMFILKRASSAIRNPEKAISNRREYVYHNWDIILIRGAFEVILIFLPSAHVSPDAIAGWFGMTIPAALSGVVSGVGGFVGLGFSADAILDWVAVSGKLPVFLQNWLKENVPSLPVSTKDGLAKKV
jgi:hypothetical protein